MSKSICLPRDQEAIAMVIAHLEKGERLLGTEIMSHTGITDRRLLYSHIEQLRMKGFLIGSSKRQDDRGYYRARTLAELKDTTNRVRSEALEMMKRSDFMEQAFLFQTESNSDLFDELFKN